MDDLSRFCCLNSQCPDHGKRGAGNLTVASRYGPDRVRRMPRCRTCKARFSERRGTPLFDSRLPPGKAESVLEHVAEGCGVRQTGRLCEVNCGTVGRLSRLAGGQARDLHDELVELSPPAPARSSSMRSGRSSPRRRRTVTPTTRPTTARGTPGTTSRSTPRAGWSCASCPASGRRRTSWRPSKG
jgi:LacI family transcriptional regulator